MVDQAAQLKLQVITKVVEILAVAQVVAVVPTQEAVLILLQVPVKVPVVQVMDKVLVKELVKV